ncbi:hypothetical protein V6Z93_010600 [Aspergillus fumigatus]
MNGTRKKPKSRCILASSQLHQLGIAMGSCQCTQANADNARNDDFGALLVTLWDGTACDGELIKVMLQCDLLHGHRWNEER